MPPDVIAPGRVLGDRYRLTRELARGGMATVWEAEDPVLSRRVAVKILHPELAIDESLRARFRHEAISAAKLTHPGIVATYDTGDDGDVAYIVMQLIDGPTLRRILDERGPMPVGDAVAIAAQVADALDFAHTHDIVHRDVKPGNVLVPPDGRVCVTDFGIAKAAGGDDLTRTGTVVGTARYLAPEQVEGDVVDGRADVYALGLVLYEMLTGRLPFSGDSDIATAMARLARDPEPVRSLRRDVPPEIDAVVSRSLVRSPDERYPSARAMRMALDAARDPSDGALSFSASLPYTPPPTARPTADRTVGIDRTAATPTPRDAPREATVVRRRRWPGLLLVLVLFVAAVGAAFAAIRSVQDDGNGGGGNGGGGGGETSALTFVPDDFDPPPGDGSEHAERVTAVRDGDSQTTWTTDRYNTRDWGNAKDGVGLVLALGGEHEIDEVVVATREAGWNADIYVADEAADDLAGWGTPVASGQELPAEHPFQLEGASGRYVLVWFTLLPPSSRLEVASIQVVGR